MIRTLIATALTATIISIPTPSHAADNIRPCEYEDSRSCIWDARHMGNGQGRSFIAGPNGGIKFITHARAHRLLRF